MIIPAFLNPAARNAAETEAALGKAGCFDIRPTAPDAVTQGVQAAMRSGAVRIAVAGGDGTVAAAAAAVANTDVELVVIPAGTFNHFARAAGIPTDLGKACEIASSGRVAATDVGYVNGRLFLNTSSVGAYANFVRVRDKLEPRFGYWGASALSIVRTLVRVRAFGVSIETDVLRTTYETPLVFIGLGERESKLPSLGRPVQNGRRGLHIVVVRGKTRARMAALAFAAAARGIRAVSRTPHLDSFLADRCTIEQRHSTVALDGEVVTLGSPLRYEVARNALRLVVAQPEEARPL